MPGAAVIVGVYDGQPVPVVHAFEAVGVGQHLNGSERVVLRQGDVIEPHLRIHILGVGIGKQSPCGCHRLCVAVVEHPEIS